MSTFTHARTHTHTHTHTVLSFPGGKYDGTSPPATPHTELAACANAAITFSEFGAGSCSFALYSTAEKQKGRPREQDLVWVFECLRWVENKGSICLNVYNCEPTHARIPHLWTYACTNDTDAELARMVNMQRIWPYHCMVYLVISCEKDRMYTVYVWFPPTLDKCKGAHAQFSILATLLVFRNALCWLLTNTMQNYWRPKCQR